LRIKPECVSCLIQRGLIEVQKATSDYEKKLKAAIKFTKVLAKHLNEKSTPSELGALRERIIKLETGNNDIYKHEKKVSNDVALKILPNLENELSKLNDEISKFRRSCFYSAVANNIEFDIPEHLFSINDLIKFFNEGKAGIDESEKIYEVVKSSRKVSLFVDNAGEVVIDKLLAQQIKSLGSKLIVAVKAYPVMNDATIKDLEYAGLTKVSDKTLIVKLNCIGFSLSKLPLKIKKELLSSDLIIATTRPELLASCRAIIIHPEDERYKKLHGLIAIVPIFNEEVPIIPHPAANIEFGTGAMMVCSFGDLSDIRLFRELKLKPKIIINPDGRLNENAGKFSGLKIEEARNKIIKELKEKGLILKEEKIIHSIPVCWRSHTPIEFIEMEEYYLKQLDFLNDLRKIIDEIKFYPPENKQILINWINSIQSDWPISRRRFYGTELPIWYCKNCGKTILPEPGKYYQPWKENPPFNKCPYCNSNKGFIGETRTVDTWVDSSISALYILKYGDT